MTDLRVPPLYTQLAEMLAHDVAAGRYLDGERLPPERVLAARLGTSVGTLRKALSILVNQGLLDRRQGSGNYVRTRPGADSVYAFFRIELLAGGGVPTAQVLDVRRLPKPDDIAPFGNHDQAHRIRRLRLLDGVPAVLEEIWLDAAYIDELSANMLADSLYLFYRESLGLWITRAQDRLSLGHVPDWAPPQFGPSLGAPCVMNSRISWSQDGTRAEVSRNWIDSTVAAYVARLS